jgi:hypothetical protein
MIADGMIGLSLTSGGNLSLAVLKGIMAVNKERVDGSAYKAQEQQPFHGQVSYPAPVCVTLD